MTLCTSIRRRTAAERERQEQLYSERYDTVYAEVEARMRAEYDEQFGPTYRAKYPFTPNGAAVHDKTQAQLKQELNAGY